MMTQTNTPIRRFWQEKHQFVRFFLVSVTFVIAFLFTSLVAVPPAFSQATITLDIRDLDTSAAIPEFSFLVNVDNTGDSSDPDPTNHPWQHPMESYSPIAAAGDETTSSFDLEDGRYLISVRADGYKVWGRHIRIDGGQVYDYDGNLLSGNNVEIELLPEPLPLASILVFAFHDFAKVNAAPDFPLEFDGLEGFNVVIEDTAGQVVIDWFGNPLCTQYSDFPGGTPVPGTGGECLTDNTGHVYIENIPHGKYEIFVIPPEPNNDYWVQTSTLEGTLALDAWLEEGADGRGAPGEILLEPAAQTAYWFGFSAPMEWENPGTGSIIGTTRNYLAFPPFEQLTYGEPVSEPWIAVTDWDSDLQVYRTRGNPDGSFTIPDVPAGRYELAIWDAKLDYIIAFRTVDVVEGQTTDMGDVGIFRWFGWNSGYVFFDNNENGIRDPGELGIVNQEVLTRFRDGSVHQGAITDANGYYEFDEARSPLGRFETLEVDFARFARTGHSVHDEQYALFNMLDPSPTVITDEVGGGLILSQVTWEGRRSLVDWGKLPYAGTDNGGISGIVIHGTTRNEFDASLAAAEDYEPGIPGVTVRLWSVLVDGNGDPILNADGFPQVDELLNEVETDSWQTPRITNLDNPVECDVRDINGVSLASPGSIEAYIAERCIEVPQLGNETKPGAYDGGWAFEDVCPAGTFPCSEVDLISPIPPGDYIVEVVEPAFYQILKEEDLNTLEGSDLQPAFPPPPCVGPVHLADVPDDYGSPFDGLMMPLCNLKFVTLQAQQNAGVEFYLFTDSDTNDADTDADAPDEDATTRNWTSTESVPPPGRFFGLVEDDITIQADPNSPTYGEPRGLPNVPIGIYEFGGRVGEPDATVGRRITTVYTDEHGFYEVMLPTNHIADCPIPSGLCPAMYVLVINDPGDPANPNPFFRTDYLTEPFVFEMFPGKMRHTDTPLDPINTLVCTPSPGTPHIFQVSTPVVNAGVETDITLIGTRLSQFDATPAVPPVVTLDDDDGVDDAVTLSVVSWTPATPFGPDGEPSTPDDSSAVFEDVAVVRIPASFPTGPAQLLVTNPVTGLTAHNGLTMHLIGGSYTPPVVTVSPPPDPNTAVIQPAIDSASDGSLIVIEPGTYHENIIMHRRVKLQGHGPGGIVGAGNLEFIDCPLPQDPQDVCPPPTLPGEEPWSHIQGSVLDGRFFTFDATKRADWDATLGSVTYAGPVTVPGGAAITVVADATEFNDTSYRPQIDGLGITSARGDGGGGIYVHAYGRNLIISNNIVEANTGGHGGAVSLGRPLAQGGLADNENDNVLMAYNRFQGNGGVFFAGGIGIFNGADNYEIRNCDICGNYSLEYGGGISHFGLSNGGSIHDNLIHFNDAFDEGGGLLIGGDPGSIPGPGLVGDGSGDVDILRNLIQANLSNDDGGGIMLLEPLTYDINIINNFVVNNIAADFGAIVLDDASDVEITNNTIAGNMSTSTAEDAILGTANCAGVCSQANSPQFQTILPPGSPLFSDPLMFNNIIWDSLAYRWDDPPPTDPDEEAGLRLIPTTFIDLDVIGVAGELDPHFSLLGSTFPGVAADNIIASAGDEEGNFDIDPMFVTRIMASRLGVLATPNRLDATQISLFFDRKEGPLAGYSDYHLLVGSPAIDAGTASLVTGTGVFPAPGDDYDHEARPIGAGFEIGADETLGSSPGHQLYFSTAADVAIPGVPGPNDDADVYSWDGVVFTRVFDGSAAGLAPGADIDAVVVVDLDTFYMSFNANAGTSVPGVGTIQDEDVVLFDAGTWSLFFDGSDVGLDSNGGEDVDAFEILPDGSVILSTLAAASVTGPGATALGLVSSHDLIRCEGSYGPTTSCTWSIYFDGSDADLSGPENIDGVSVRHGDGSIFLSTSGDFSVTGLTGANEDVFVCEEPAIGGETLCELYSMYFDGSANGVPSDLDAIDMPVKGLIEVAVEIVSPINGSTVSGDVLVQADNTSNNEGAELEWNQDGGPWLPLTLNTTTGLYEANWDTTLAADGSHTINVRAFLTDGGLTALDSVVVTVDNGTPATCTTNCLRVSDISFSVSSGVVRAFVTVVDENGDPVPRASVVVTWDLPTSLDVTEIMGTNAGGVARFRKVDGSGTYVLTVDNVVLSGYTFDPDGSSELSDSTAVP